jgi:ATP-dependent RNA helicase RhlE
MLQTTFLNMNLPKPLKVRLDRQGFRVPTPIQREAIPPAVEGRDVVGIAQTGTGKTLAFGIPMAVRLKPGQLGLVLAPTRELAQQIEETLHKLGLRTALLIGGAPMGRQVAQLRAKPGVVVATPGRLLDHMGQRTADLRHVAIAVLDEADRMLDMGFAPAIRQILDATPKSRQTMLFSATMPKEIEDLAKGYQRDPLRIEVARAGTAAELVDQVLFVVPHEDKVQVLKSLLEEHTGTVLVFTRTRHGARKLAKSIRNLGHTAAEIHSDRTLPQRREALAGFKSGKHRVLVATDIASRGIDVKEISVVINYDVPEHPEDYVHRIGRTGRAGATGKAVTLATPEQNRDVRDIEKLMKAEISLSPSSPLPMDRGPKHIPVPPIKKPSRGRRRPAFGRKGS